MFKTKENYFTIIWITIYRTITMPYIFKKHLLKIKLDVSPEKWTIPSTLSN